MIVLNGDSGITTPTYGGTDTSEYLVPVTGFKNRIINGAMQIDQRNAGASVTPTSGQYLVDRFVYISSQSSKFTAQQNAASVTPPVGFTNYQGLTVSSAVSIGTSDYFLIRQAIEGFNIADLGWGTANAKAITLSFQIYSSLTGTFGGALSNSAYNRSYPFTYSIPVANTWTTISITIAGDTTGTWLTNNGVGIYVQFGLGNGSTYSGTAGAWATAQYFSATGATSVVGTSGATFYITGVQLEKGSTATSFDYRPYGTELALCQRYYETTGTTTFGNAIAFRGYVVSGADYTAKALFQVTKRAAPTITLTNEFNIAFSSTTGTAGGVGDRGFNETRTANASSNSGLFSSYYTASAEL